MTATPVAARSALQSVVCDSQFHWPGTYTVTVPSPLSTLEALIVPRIGLPASANALAAVIIRAQATARVAAVAARVRQFRARSALIVRPPVLSAVGPDLDALARSRRHPNSFCHEIG